MAAFVCGRYKSITFPSFRRKLNLQRFLPILGLLLTLPVCAATPLPGALSTIQQIRQLTPAQADQARPVSVEGVVTYYKPAEHILFIQDETAAIFIRTRHIFPFIAGDRILAHGVTAPSYHNVIASEQMRVIGKAPLPRPVPADFPGMMAGRSDCAYVTASGVILSASIQRTLGPPFLLLQVLMDGGPVAVHVENPGRVNLHHLLDARVVLTGVSSEHFDGKFQLVGAMLYLNSPANMRIISPAPSDPEALPLTPMDKVMGTYNVVERTPRVRVRGVVTLYEPGSLLAIENGGNAVLVHTQQATPLSIGSVVDATGFADARNYSQSLKYGQFSLTGQVSAVHPQPVQWEDATAGKYAFNLISIEGELIEQAHEARQDTLFVSSGGHVFSAMLRHVDDPGAHLPSFPLGSLIRVSGVCFVESGGAWNNAVGFDLHLRSPEDVRVLARASWWTVPHLLYVIGALGVVILIALGWGEMLRRRVRHQEQIMRRGMEEEAARERCQIALEKERGRVLEAINSRLPLHQVLRIITELISTQMEGLDCRCEVAASGAVESTAPSPGGNPRQFRRDILSGAGERLGSLILAWDDGTTHATHSEVLDMGVSLAALAIDNRRLYEGLVRRSEYDQLTDVPNRFYLESRLKNVLASARREQRHFALIYIDLDRFKSVNDRFGHRVGDIYLQHVARRLQEKLRGQDTLARVGGDEFVVLIPIVRDRPEAEEIVWRLTSCFTSPFRIDDHIIEGSASMGVALYPEDGENPDQLQRFADSAMYAAKHHFAWLGSRG